MFECAREFFTVLVTASMRVDGPVVRQSATKEFDKSFEAFVDDVRERIEMHVDDDLVRHNSYIVAKQRAIVELLARLLQLLRLNQDVQRNDGRFVTPWEFIVQQVADPSS